MKNYFLNLFVYNEWANNRIINTIKNLHEPPYKTELLMSHIISTQDLWLERIQKKEKPTIGLWDEMSIQECAVLSPISNSKWINYIKRLTKKDVEKTIDYFNTKGDPKSNQLIDILIHVTNHSNYHRAQISQILSNSNIKPPVIDYIFFAREKEK